MIILMYFIVSLIIHVSCPKCNKRTQTWEEKLSSDITRNYHKQPDRKYTNTTVAVQFSLRYYTFDETTQKFYIYSYMTLKWLDDSLKWNPEDYDGIDRTNVKTTRIWTPKIIQKDDDNYIFKSLHFFLSTCMVSYDGGVVCIPEMSHSGDCQSRMSNWPYDIHTCQIKFTAKDNVKIIRNGTVGVSTNDAEQSNGWTLILSSYTESEEKPDEITLTFVVERQAVGLVAMHVIPLILIAILNVTALVIDVENVLRVYVLSFCFICYVDLVQTLNENVPKFGPDVPKIIVFLRNSLFLCAFSIFITFIFKSLRRCTNSPSAFVLRFNSFFQEISRKNMVLWKRCEVSLCDKERSETSVEWAVFVKILNSFTIITSCAVFFVLLVVYVPRRINSIN